MVVEVKKTMFIMLEDMLLVEDMSDDISMWECAMAGGRGGAEEEGGSGCGCVVD